MDIKTVAKLAEIIDKYGLTKIDITDTSVRYLLERENALPPFRQPRQFPHRLPPLTPTKAPQRSPAP